MNTARRGPQQALDLTLRAQVLIDTEGRCGAPQFTLVRQLKPRPHDLREESVEAAKNDLALRLRVTVPGNNFVGEAFATPTNSVANARRTDADTGGFYPLYHGLAQSPRLGNEPRFSTSDDCSTRENIPLISPLFWPKPPAKAITGNCRLL